MAKIEVPYFGVHRTPAGIAFLMQATGGKSVTGIKLDCPFAVKTIKAWYCNHNFSLHHPVPARAHLNLFRELVIHNDLVRFMLPLPGEGVAVIGTHTPSRHLLRLVMLTKMTSPVREPILWLKGTSMAHILSELEMTNVQPLILMGVEIEDTDKVQMIIQIAATKPRRLLVVSNPDVPINPKIDTNGFFTQDITELALLPWEQLGAIVLRAWMRGEWTGTWFSREMIPNNEMRNARAVEELSD